MWIRWKYNDHGWPDFKELEIPDDFDGYETVQEYLIERRDLNIPTWSERYDSRRIHWEEVKLSPEELNKRTISKLKATVDYHQHHLIEAQKKLEKYEQADHIITCVYCGQAYPENTPTHGADVQVLTDHIKVCPKHPMSKVVAENKELRLKIQQLEAEIAVSHSRNTWG